MPIATCFLNPKIDINQISGLVTEWAGILEVEERDICINVITNFHQFGRDYEILVHLSLPSVWKEREIREIQTSLLGLLSRYCRVAPEKIFIMTNIIHSGHVVDDGEIVTW
jgi:hypothetical protein